jgi:hypothetical protein
MLHEVHLWILGFISFSIVALSRYPNHFFGATATLLFFASSTIFIAKSNLAKVLIIAFFCFSTFMLTQSLVRTNLDYPSRDASVTQPSSKIIFDTMEKNAIKSLYIPFQGQVNAITLNWESMKNDLQLAIDDSSVMPTLKQSSNRAKELGAILCPKPEADYYTYLPSAATTKVICDSGSDFKNWSKIDMSVNYFILFNRR